MNGPQNFNTQEAINTWLQTHLEAEKIPAESQSRIFVGLNGGIAYKIFPENAPRNIKLTSLEYLEIARDYIINAVQSVRRARTHAAGYGFDLVSLDEGIIHNRKPSEFSKGAYSYSDLAVGDATIESYERLARFLKMVREGNQIFNTNQHALETLSKKLISQSTTC